MHAPKYLSVPEHQACLGSFIHPLNSYSEKCLPMIKPPACLSESWKEIQRVFVGKKCPETNTMGTKLLFYLILIIKRNYNFYDFSYK